MKWISFIHETKEKYGIYHAEEKEITVASGIRQAPATLAAAVLDQTFAASFQAQANQLPRLKAEEVKWLSPIPRPLKNIMCVGKNYRDHAVEMGGESSIPEHPMIFTKAPTAVIGHQSKIPSHSELTGALDYEGELAVVIGKTGRNIARSEAFDFVFGYTILNDVTARDLQSRHKQFFIGKSLDGSCPIGPWVVTKDEIPDPHRLDVETRVNGEVRQRANTSQLIFPIDEIIHVLSRGMTLEAGDIIATGTPAGVGFAMNPKATLQPGDKVEITVEGIGTLSNEVEM